MCTYSEIASGGDSRVAWELARYMSKETDNEVWMICPDTSYDSRKDIVEEKLMVQTVTSNKIFEGVNIFSPTILGIRKIYKILEKLNPDIIHAHNVDPLAVVVQGWAITKHVPFIYTGHLLATQFNSWQDLKLQKAIEPLINESLEAYTKNYYKNCTNIICLNKFAKEDFVTFTKQPSKMVVIPNGHTFLESKIEHISLRKDSTYKLLFSGYISERKNQLFLVKMLREIDSKKKIELTLAGACMTPEYKELVEEAIKDLPSNIKIILPGYVEHNTLLEMYNNTHYLVSAATAEVQSLSVIESLAIGTPVIGLANTTTLELINNGKNGEVLDINSTPKQFAEVLARYLDKTGDEYEKLSKNSIESVKFLEYSNVAKRYCELYKNLITKKSKPITDENTWEKLTRLFKLNEEKGIRVKGNINYALFLGIMSIAVVGGLGIITATQKLKKLKDKKE